MQIYTKVTKSALLDISLFLKFNLKNESSGRLKVLCYQNYKDFFAFQMVAKVAKATTVTELMGIRMAATTGESFPDRA